VQNSEFGDSARIGAMRRCHFSISALLLAAGLAPSVLADWSLTTRGTLYYTSDASLFTASQRLSRDADPTQPALDTRLTGQGSDGVLETMAQVGRTLESSVGTSALDLRGDGYVFFDHADYSNGNVAVQAKHAFPSKTTAMVRFYYNPDLFLGNNLERRSGHFQIAPEQVTSSIGAMHLAQELADELELRLFARYGTRRYNQDYAERNTDFWTIGPHLDWTLLPGVTLGLAYHYEKGLAAGRHQAQYEDDVSYINNFAAADLEFELGEKFVLSFAFDYEHNDWLSHLRGDERNGAYEQIFQGEALLIYQATEALSLHTGIQHGSRKVNLEPVGVAVTNFGLGIKARF